LHRTDYSDLYSIVIASVDGSLNLLSQAEISAGELGANFPSALAFFDPGRVVITGSQRGDLPSLGSIALTSQASLTLWQDISPAQGSPSQLVVQATPVALTELTDFGFNRDANDHDAFVFLTPF
jgi:hypothetical protein